MARIRGTRGEYAARKILVRQLEEMEAIERRKQPKPPKVNGPRAKFLEKYKLEGYESAKSEVNAGFNGKEVYTDEILNAWIKEDNEK